MLFAWLKLARRQRPVVDQRVHPARLLDVDRQRAVAAPGQVLPHVIDTVVGGRLSACCCCRPAPAQLPWLIAKIVSQSVTSGLGMVALRFEAGPGRCETTAFDAGAVDRRLHTGGRLQQESPGVCSRAADADRPGLAAL